MCGGTGIAVLPASGVKGLSPRVRGNPARWTRRQRRKRSIPACAGEPPFLAKPARAPTVYPRVCGGTSVKGIQIPLGAGLSPRVRGNRCAPP